MNATNKVKKSVEGKKDKNAVATPAIKKAKINDKIRGLSIG